MTEPCVVLQKRGGWWEDRLCERCTFPIGPRNTWSNVAYLIGGGVIVWRDSSAAGIVMAVAMLALAIGSTLYHGYKTRFANNLDIVGMYLVFGSLGTHGFAPTHHLTPWIMGVTGLALATLMTYVLSNITLEVQIGVLLWFALVPGLVHDRLGGVVLSFALFLVSYGAWNLDVAHRWTGKWGHAAWHLLTAAAITVAYLTQ